MDDCLDDRRLTGAIALMVALLMAPAGARAFDETRYPNLKGQWDRIGPPNWTPAGKPPFTSEYQAVYEANRADMAKGGAGGVPSQYCFPQGMPMMNIYDPMEFVVTSDAIGVLVASTTCIAGFIPTDGWPGESSTCRPMAIRSAMGR